MLIYFKNIFFFLIKYEYVPQIWNMKFIYIHQENIPLLIDDHSFELLLIIIEKRKYLIFKKLIQ